MAEAEAEAVPRLRPLVVRGGTGETEMEADDRSRVQVRRRTARRGVRCDASRIDPTLARQRVGFGPSAGRICRQPRSGDPPRHLRQRRTRGADRPEPGETGRAAEAASQPVAAARAAEVPAVAKGFTDDRARRVFLTYVLTGVRRSELERLRGGHVNLLEGTLRVIESKSEEGERLIALPPALIRELSAQFAETTLKSDCDFVFAHPTLGNSPDDKWFREQFVGALKSAGITERVRVHDLRHTALTNLAATGASPIAVMATAGHRSMQTTKRYLHLAGVTFALDAAALERRLLAGELSTELSTDLGEPESTSSDVSDATMRPHASAS